MSEEESSPIHNRLLKNVRKLQKMARLVPTDCYRLYDKDIPEYPSQIDVYGPYVILHDRRDTYKDVGPIKQQNYDDTIEAILHVLQITEDFLIIKERKTYAHKGGTAGAHQYEKQLSVPVSNAVVSDPRRIVVTEGRAKFRINLLDYIDVGLFLDHRPLRLQFAKGLNNARVLNLFSYTSSVSVAAALGGATTTSVDLSNTYIDWSQDNFELNGIALKNHEFLVADVLTYLAQKSAAVTAELFDVIFLDPPTFSNSKKMESDSFEIQRDHEFLVESCMKLLSPQGTLYFSNNRRDFRLAKSVTEKFDVNQKTEWSLPPDFRDPKTHHLTLIRHK